MLIFSSDGETYWFKDQPEYIFICYEKDWIDRRQYCLYRPSKLEIHKDFLHPEIYAFIKAKHDEAEQEKHLSVVDEVSSHFSIQSPLKDKDNTLFRALEEIVDEL